MRAFTIKAGTDVHMIPRDTYAVSGFHPSRVKPYTTEKDKMFFIEDMIIDPLGHVGTGPQHKVTIGGYYAERGWYGFALADPHEYPHGDPDSRWYAVLVPMTEVEVN
jgi:hypothetical protein